MIAAAAAVNINLVLIALIIVALIVGLVMVWDQIPWWINFPTPRRQYRVDREYVKDCKLRLKHARFFTDPATKGVILAPPEPPDPPASPVETLAAAAAADTVAKKLDQA